MVEDCAGNILEKLKDDTRDVWTTDDVEEFLDKSLFNEILMNYVRPRRFLLVKKKD
jgi:hypothetical protein